MIIHKKYAIAAVICCNMLYYIVCSYWIMLRWIII